MSVALHLMFSLFLWSTGIARADVEVYDLAYEGQRIRVALVHAGPHPGAIRDQVLEGQLRELATNFMISEYVARGTLNPGTDAKMIEQLQTTEGMKDGRSHLMVVLKPGAEGAIGEPIGILRVASQTEDRPFLPYEERTLGRGVREVSKFKLTPVMDAIMPVTRPASENGRANFPIYRKAPTVTGAHVEVKNYVISKNSPVELAPLMYHTMENAGWLSESLYPSKPTPIQMTRAGLKKVSDRPNQSPRASVSEIYLETGEGGLQAFYERLGFKTHLIFDDPDIASKRTVVMKMDRPTFLKLLEKMANRPGAEFLRNARVEPLSQSHRAPGMSCPQFFRLIH